MRSHDRKPFVERRLSRPQAEIQTCTQYRPFMDVHSFRQSGVGQARKESWPSRLVRLGKRHFAMAHRDDLADSCALAALASDAARSSPGFKKVYEDELRKSLHAICVSPDERSPIDPARLDDAIAFMALRVGGISLARAVNDPGFSEQILTVCRQAIQRMATPDNESSSNVEGPDHGKG